MFTTIGKTSDRGYLDADVQQTRRMYIYTPGEELIRGLVYRN